MALKPFWNKKHHLKLTPDELDKKLLFNYVVNNEAVTGKVSDIKLMNDGDNDSELDFIFLLDGEELYLDQLRGKEWQLRTNSYNVPITNEEAQTLLTTGQLVQDIDRTEFYLLTSPLVYKCFAGFYGTLLYNHITNSVSGVVYEATLTQKAYFVSITPVADLPDYAARWMLIPLT